MKEKYSQPVLVIQQFKVMDAIMAGASGRECHSMWCSPNGMPSEGCIQNAFCPTNCYSCGVDSSGIVGWGKDYGAGMAQ